MLQIGIASIMNVISSPPEKPTAIRVLKSASLQFQQIILDYFYSPPSWSMDRWKPAFFKATLPQLARDEILLLGGTIILPFQRHILDQVASYEGALTPYYKILTLYETELNDSYLWRGTNACDACVLSDVFGKDPVQEVDMYCRATRAELSAAAAARFGSITDLEKARFLVLKRFH